MVFAARVAEGAKGLEQCVPLTEENRSRIAQYMSGFQLDV
jgi:hypothetical protein